MKRNTINEFKTSDEYKTLEQKRFVLQNEIDTLKNEQKINELLRDDWDFDRLSMLEQAILLISFQEILANDTPKAVVINEAITLAKKYCDDNSYKLLNGVLDQL